MTELLLRNLLSPLSIILILEVSKLFNTDYIIQGV